ncbi:hypothetical protein CC79DRAFT_1364659 [Sarocladium strictum]
MCLQTVRQHMCRHCRSEWTQADILELCPEGDKIISKHGYCAPVQRLLEMGGHHVSLGQIMNPPHQQQQQQLHNGGGHIYPLLRTPSIPNATVGMGPRVLEDMCEDCKDKHYRDWAVEARARQAQQQQQQAQQQAQHGHSHLSGVCPYRR